MKTISRYIMTLALLLTAVTGAWAQTQWESGDCTVTLNNGTLTVSGNGTMDNYANPSDRPWDGNKGDITSVVVESGVTSVGMIAFVDFSTMTSVTLPEGLTAIGPNAFSSCSSLTSITIPSTVTSIGEGAFTSCSSLQSITIPSKVTSIGVGAFYSCSAISDVYLYANPDNLTWGDASYDFIESKATQCHVLAEHLSTYQNNFSSANVTFVGDLEPLATSDVKVTPGSSANTWTFAMPGSDVVLTPQYAPAAKWDVVESVEQMPAALEGIIAGQDAAIVTAGQSAQGTVMYAVTTTAEAAPELTAFSATVPTAENIADDGADVYVWYYIQGADAPDGDAATLDNTFNDTEPACLTVTVLTNKFDITFNAANANTIEAGKATVTVGGTAATVTDGKLQGVKMGSEVKLEAKPGYKFRKVEVKKKAPAPSLNITNPAVGQVIGSDGKNYVSGTLPTGVTAVAKICYVSGSHGLALALTDEGIMDWSTAQTTCAAHTPAFTGGTWKLATKDEWDNMINAIGSDDDLRDGFSIVGGTNMESGSYCSSTEDGSSSAWYYLFLESIGWSSGDKDFYYCVRACLAF